MAAREYNVLYWMAALILVQLKSVRAFTALGNPSTGKALLRASEGRKSYELGGRICWQFPLAAAAEASRFDGVNEDQKTRHDSSIQSRSHGSPNSFYQKRPFTSNSETEQRIPIRSTAPLVVPVPFIIPEMHSSIEIGFVRSSGAGGQNVNKVNTQAQIRLHLPSASWLPLEVRHRIQRNEANRISKSGHLILNSQEHRTQTLNKQSALTKLRDICIEGYRRPKIRKLRNGPTKSQKEKRLREKKLASEKKQNRKRII